MGKPFMLEYRLHGVEKQRIYECINTDYHFVCIQDKSFEKTLNSGDFPLAKSDGDIKLLLDSIDGKWIITRFDASGNVENQFYSTVTGKDSAGEPVSQTIEKTFLYQDSNNPTKKTKETTVITTNSVPKTIVENYTYHICSGNLAGKLFTIADNFGYVTKIEYDSDGFEETITINHTSKPYEEIIIDLNEEYEIPSNDVNYVTPDAVGGLIKSLKSGPNGATRVDYDYDLWGRRKFVKLNQTTPNHVNYTFEDNGDTISATYAGNETFKMMLDKFGKTKKIRRGTKEIVSNFYDSEHRLINTADNYEDWQATQISYGTDGDITQIRQGDVTITPSPTIDGQGEKVSYQIKNRPQQVYIYEYDDPYNVREKTTTLPTGNNDEEITQFDAFGRITQIELPKQIDNTFQYAIDNGEATGKISVFENKTGDYVLQYDNDGNIQQIQYGNTTYIYSYDEYGRLKSDSSHGSYTYDDNGNITSRTWGGGANSVAYVYNDPIHKDRLMSFDGKQFTYNALGNPTLYKGDPMEWDFKNLRQYRKTRFEYTADGLRKTKIHGNTVTTYYWAGDKLIGEKRTTVHSGLELGKPIPQGGIIQRESHMHIEYIYGTTGMIGFTLQRNTNPTETYWYVKNLFGDVTTILDNNGQEAANYSQIYSAWGTHSVANIQDNIGDINPIRYRGYYYDPETRLYYLQSRYYDPETGRLVSPDCVDEIRPFEPNGLNLYAYCGNNPIMYIDPDGRNPLAIFLAILGLAGLGIGVGMVVSGAGGSDKLSMQIQSGVTFVVGVGLMFVPGLQGLGASLIGSSILGFAGGYVSEALGGSYGLGWGIGSVVGGIAGGGAYRGARYAHSSWYARYWDKGTYASSKASMLAHYGRHGQGVGYARYTKDALYLSRNFSSQAVWKTFGRYGAQPGWSINQKMIGMGKGLYTDRWRIIYFLYS